MKVLSVQQPWAWAIVCGGKCVENRTWSTPYRGPLLIHAGVSRDRLGDLGDGEPPVAEMVFGAVIGIVELVEVCHFDDLSRTWRESRWTESGGFCWLLESPRAFAVPVPLKGRLGLFDPPKGFTLPG